MEEANLYIYTSKKGRGFVLRARKPGPHEFALHVRLITTSKSVTCDVISYTGVFFRPIHRVYRNQKVFEYEVKNILEGLEPVPYQYP
jgi:hypothetical protein